MILRFNTYDSGPPLPPDPVLVINSSSQLDIQWEIPYSHNDYPVESYNIQIVNTSSGNVLEGPVELQPNETSYVYTFEDEVQYCQILTVNVTAVSALGSSVPGSVSRGFPIGETNFVIMALQPLAIIKFCLHAAPQLFESAKDIIIAVMFSNNETATANISFKVCSSNLRRHTIMCCLCIFQCGLSAPLIKMTLSYTIMKNINLAKVL